MATKPKSKALNKRHIARLTLHEILNFYPISHDKAFKIANVHRTTWERWLSGESHPHPAIVELIRLHALGEPIDPAFKGFAFNNGKLYNDHGKALTPGDLRVFHLYQSHSLRYMQILRDFDLVPKQKEKGAAEAKPFKLHLVKSA